MSPVVQLSSLEPAIDSITYYSDQAILADYPLGNLFKGSSLQCRTSSAGNLLTIYFDFGFGVTKSIDHVILRGLDLLFAQLIDGATISFAIYGNTSRGVAGGALLASDSTIELGDLVGPNGSDFIKLLSSASAAYRYYYIQLSHSGPAIQYRLRGLTFGSRFTFGGISPMAGYGASYSKSPIGFQSDFGNMFRTTMGRKRREHIFTWRGITDALRDEFESKFLKYADDYPIFIYGPSGESHDPLSGNQLLFGWIVDSEIKMGQWNRDHTILIAFQEDVI